LMRPLEDVHSLAEQGRLTLSCSDEN